MIDVDKLDNDDYMQNYLIFISKQIKDYKKYMDLLSDSEDMKNQIKPYDLKNLEEVTGTLLLISIDPKDPTVGYCLIDLGDEMYNIMIHDPKRVFTEWEESLGIVYQEKVGILRMDDKGKTVFHLRYISKEISEVNKKITREIMKITDYESYIDNKPSTPLLPD